MKRQLKTVVALTAAAAMTMASVMTVSAAAMKRDRDYRWRLVNEDGSYATNQWYQTPGGIWYYFGEDGYLLKNATTPDGYYVDGLGAWVPEGVEDAYVPSVQEAVQMYKDYLPQPQGFFSSENFVFVDLNGDGIPECIAIS